MMRWLLLSVSLVFPSALAAEKVGLGSLPRKAKAAGFTAAVSVDGVATHGYQPVYIDFTAVGGPFPGTRNLRVMISPRGNGDNELDFDAQHSLQLPQGARAFQTTAYVPYYFSWNTLTVRIFEDGEMIDTGDATFNTQVGRLQPILCDSTVGILVPRDAGPTANVAWKRFPDVRTLTTVLGEGPLPEDTDVDRLGHNPARAHAISVQPAKVQFRPIDEDLLHPTWLGYSQLDIILVASPLLRRIGQEQPEQLAAIEDWIAAGGNLWIYAADETTKQLFPAVTLAAPPTSAALRNNRLQDLLQLSQDNDTSGWSYNPWRGPYRQSADYAWNASGQTGVKGRREVFDDLEKAEHPFVAGQEPNDFQASIRHGAFGAGTITTIAIDDPFPGSFLMWESIKQLHSDDQLHWVKRNGISVPNGDRKYWSFLIESVGQPPVKSFILLNTLFVIAIGPVCYFFFRRRERLYLLFFVAPAIAFLITGSLFVYALAADGIRTRAQTKTLTWLDPHSEYAVTETLHTYYSVLSQREGLRFSEEALVSPVRGVPLTFDYRSRNRHPSAKRLAFTDEAQWFRGAFLPTRDQVQYLTLEPKRDSPSFRFDFTSDPQSPRVENPFPYAVQQILVRDEQRQYWVADAIGPGGEGHLRPTFLQVQLQAQPFADNPLLERALYQKTASVPTLSGWNAGYRMYQGNSLGNEPSQLDKRLMQWLTAGLPPKRFVAIAESPDETLAVDSATVVEDVHVLMGELP